MKISRYRQLVQLAAELEQGRAEMAEKLERVQELCGEIRDWFDAMNENWQQGERGQKAERVADLEADADTLLADLDAAIQEIQEAADGQP